jgi:Ca2+-binding RTX toxin-like protein
LSPHEDSLPNYASGGPGNDTITGTSKADVLVGFAGNDVLLGLAGNDSLVGGQGDDTLIGGAGYNVLTGGAGKDQFVISAENRDWITDFKVGEDKIRLTGLTFSQIQIVAGTGVYAGNAIVKLPGVQDPLVVFAGLPPSAITRNDFIEDSVVPGGKVIYGENGDDLIFGTTGSDRIFVNNGKNTVFASDGADYIRAGVDDDIIYGGAGNDDIVVGEGNNYVDAGSGNDVIFTGSGNDTILGNAGDDIIHAGAGDNIIDAGVGNDTVYVWGTGKNTFALNAGVGSVTIFGFELDDKFKLGAGLTATDVKLTVRGNDTLISQGDDLLATLTWTKLTALPV